MRNKKVGSGKSEVRSSSDFELQTSDFDREVERLLAIDPSPEFAARVRTRIAREPAPSSWSVSWMFAVAGVAVAAIVFTIVMARPAQKPAPAPIVAKGSGPAKEIVGSGSLAGSGSLVGSGFSRTYRTPVRPAEPETLIDPREAMALQRLIAGVRDGRVDLSPVLHAATPTAMDLPPIADLVIAPLTIEPLAPIEGAEGVRQ